MLIGKDYLSKFKITNKSDEFLLAKQIWLWDKSLNFGMLRSLIKRKGLRFVRDCFLRAEKDKISKKGFLWLVGQIKIVYRNVI